ncbi:MAG: NUDIX hydrolase [Fimbriimonadaceae bacterium]|nr:NUDIX hydrolase [Chitinophagales bacterium]
MEELVQLVSDVIIKMPESAIVLVRRKYEPFKGVWSLPGGKMNKMEVIEDTAMREAKEETGLLIQLKKLVGVYSQVSRDPRGRYVSVVYEAIPIGGNLKAGSDAAEILVTSDYKNLILAFDHSEILKDYDNMNYT